MKAVMKWMVDVCLRPPRANYDLNKTVCLIEGIENEVYIRKDVTFNNSQNITLHGSFWHNKDNPTPTSCLIFLHSLGTNQLECVNLVPFVCTHDLALFSFDFTGSGISDGDIIPLVGNGCHDVLSAAELIRNKFGITQIGIWGRSMGAAIALETVSFTNEFVCVVADSSFSSPENIVFDQAKNYGFPKLLVNFAKPYFIKEALKIVGPSFDITYPLKDVSYSSTPLLLGHGKVDAFVPLNHAKDLFNQYGCLDKQFYIFDGNHNTSRPNQWYETAARFIYRKLGIDMKPRVYEKVYKNALLHIGILDDVLDEYANGISGTQYLHDPNPNQSQ